MSMVRNRKGFTLIEIIVVAGIIAVLAGILVPLIFKEIDESKTSRAMADVKSISSAIIVSKKDTGQWPVNENCNAAASLLASAGTAPTALAGGWDASLPVVYDNLLNTDPGCYADGVWKGPYMAMVNADPWGYQYVTNSKNMLVANGGGPLWIISPGPNGKIDTAATDTQLCNGAKPCDDIGVRLR